MSELRALIHGVHCALARLEGYVAAEAQDAERYRALRQQLVDSFSPDLSRVGTQDAKWQFKVSFDPMMLRQSKVPHGYLVALEFDKVADRARAEQRLP